MVRRARGFTLVELMVASAVALFIVAGAGAMLGQMVLQHRRDTEYARLRASLDLALSRLAQDLRHAGLGLPTAFAPGATTLTPLLRAGQSELVLAGDLPYPEAVLNGWSLALPDWPLAPSGEELVVLDDELGEKRSTAAETEADAKHREKESAILVNSRGEWTPLAGSSPSKFLVGPNRGFVSTPDRVFYRLDGDVLLRQQCWGPIPQQAETEPCRANDGTEWERLISGVRELRFEYTTAAGAGLGPLPLSPELRSQVRRVRVRLAVRATAAEKTFDLVDETLVALRQ